MIHVKTNFIPNCTTLPSKGLFLPITKEELNTIAELPAKARKVLIESLGLLQDRELTGDSSYKYRIALTQIELSKVFVMTKQAISLGIKQLEDRNLAKYINGILYIYIYIQNINYRILIVIYLYTTVIKLVTQNAGQPL